VTIAALARNAIESLPRWGNGPGSGGKMAAAENSMDGGTEADVGTKVIWARRVEIPPFSPAPGIQVQPVIGESLMTCWIAMEPGAVVVEHSHPNEQLGVVVEGSVTLASGDDSRELVAGDAYVMPSDLLHSAVAGTDGVLLVETFVPVREDYARAWRAVAEGAEGGWGNRGRRRKE
jgi:quercetin dioxygenase-like cupin family protein